jgi:hypothetical protein
MRRSAGFQEQRPALSLKQKARNGEERHGPKSDEVQLDYQRSKSFEVGPWTNAAPAAQALGYTCEVKMKKFALIVFAGASLLGTGIASAQYGGEGYWQRRGQEYGLPCDNTRWCAQYSGGRAGGGTNCGFFTWNQCMATVSGVGGFCVVNQFYNPCGSAGRAKKRRY